MGSLNKRIILNALRDQLHSLQFNLDYDRAEAAYYWDESDKSDPSTAPSHEMYKYYKNQIRATKTKLAKIRETIRQVKIL